MTYHTMFKNINPKVVKAVREAIKGGLFRQINPVAEKQAILQELHKKVCEIYKLPVIKIKFDENCYSVGNFNHITNEITCNKPSLVTWAHEFAHYMRVTKGLHNTEKAAQGWSHSLFFLATPKLFEKACLSGKLIWQNSMNDRQEVQDDEM